mgnify:FL=1
MDVFIEAARAVTVGHPVDNPGFIGPLVSRAAADRVREVIDGAVRAGARALLPGGASPLVTGRDAYCDPCILVDVEHGMDAVRSELFGPVASVICVRDDDEAVQLMNDTEYGLTASIWTADLDRAQALGRQVRSGTLYVNRCDHADINLPWGGVKQSGVGRSYGEEGLRELTQQRAWHIRPLPGLR